MKKSSFGTHGFEILTQALIYIFFRLKLYTRVPPNGLVVYCGTIVTEEGKEKKVNIDLNPSSQSTHRSTFATTSFIQKH